MQHYAAFHLGLHCLPKYSFRVSRKQRVNKVYFQMLTSAITVGKKCPDLGFNPNIQPRCIYPVISYFDLDDGTQCTGGWICIVPGKRYEIYYFLIGMFL